MVDWSVGMVCWLHNVRWIGKWIKEFSENVLMFEGCFPFTFLSEENSFKTRQFKSKF